MSWKMSPTFSEKKSDLAALVSFKGTHRNPYDGFFEPPNFFAVYRKSNGWEKLLKETFQDHLIDQLINAGPIQCHCHGSPFSDHANANSVEHHHPTSTNSFTEPGISKCHPKKSPAPMPLKVQAIAGPDELGIASTNACNNNSLASVDHSGMPH